MSQALRAAIGDKRPCTGPLPRHGSILQEVDPTADPGWRTAVRDALLGLVPLWGLWYRKSRTDRDPLVVLRSVYLTFVAALASIALVVVILDAAGEAVGRVGEGQAAVVVVVVGLATLAAPRLIRRPLPCASSRQLAAGYRTRMFVDIAFAEAAALVGFVGFMLSGAGWIYLVGAGFSAIGFTRSAPTQRNLHEDQDELRRNGCTLALIPALRERPGNLTG